MPMGGPGSRLEGQMYEKKAAEYGFRLIATDRQGMGQSTFKSERVLLDYPQDLADLADALGIGKFGVMGHSGGGAHTTVCGYALPDRITFNMPSAGYTNFAELPGAADLLRTKADRMSVGLSKKHPRLFFDLMALNVKYLPESYYKAVASAGNETDKKITEDPEFKKHLIADQKEALIQDGRGVTVDAAVHYVDWGFRLKDISGKVHVFHGTEDNFVPVKYAEHLAENIPNCEIHRLEGQSHLFPWDHQELIFKTALAEISSSP